MKICALLSRKKGRDFYDIVTLLENTTPDYGYLRQQIGIDTPEELKKAVLAECRDVDLAMKVRDVERLLFDPAEKKKIMLFRDYMAQRGFPAP